VAPESAPVDSRADRASQGAVAVILLSAFVFSQSWVIPVLGVLVGAGAAFGPAGNPFHRLYAAFIAPRLSKPTTFEDPVTVRVQDMLTVALLGLATLALLISLKPVAWVIALAAAGVAATAATTGVHLGLAVRDLIRRRA
jgi:thiosulfate/3-mercaptopyruvate sulfurtransferase